MTEAGGTGLTGLVLAGGESRRMGVASKALIELAEKPMIEHVLTRLDGQVDRILISVHETREGLGRFGHEQVVDVVVRQRGPLAGLVSGLLRLECRGFGEWLLLSPCDAPFLPIDLGARLFEAARQIGKNVAVARYEHVLQPVFSLWRLDVLPVLKQALMERGQGGLMSVLDALPYAIVDWPLQDPSPFFNVNTAAELRTADRLVDEAARGH